MGEGKEVTEVTEEVQKYIKKGDVLICKKNSSSITIGNSYKVNDFYYFEGRPYGIMITDDAGDSHQICNTLVTELFYLPNNQTDMVNHPPHYTSHPSGIECITITRHYCFSIGNAIKYLWRAGLKKDASLEDKQKEIEDLEKSIWYINDRIKQLRDDKA